MQHIWNRASLLALVPLLTIALSVSPDANASTTASKKQPVHKTANKKASANPHVKAPVRKSTPSKAKVVYRQNKQAVNPSADHDEPATRGGVRHASLDLEERNASGALGLLAPHAALRSEVAFVQDLESSTILFDKNSDEVRPIASISKLMTALVIAEAGQPMNDTLVIADADVDRVRHSRSRLSVGTKLSRADMLHLALMSSENRAAHALARYYPGGMPAFVRAMNDKARSLGMRNSRFVEPTGLSVENVASPRDLVKLLRAATKQPLIHRYTTDDKYEVDIGKGRQLVYNNTNGLVRKHDWHIQISKTGFINEAGECLVMVTRIDNRDVAIVLLNSTGRYSRIGDAVRVRTLVEKAPIFAML